MNIRRNFVVAALMTVVTDGRPGCRVPVDRDRRGTGDVPGPGEWQLIARNGHIVGSLLIGQAFSAPEYFHGRPSAAGTG